jgi:hypothetical protein
MIRKFQPHIPSYLGGNSSCIPTSGLNLVKRIARLGIMYVISSLTRGFVGHSEDY